MSYREEFKKAEKEGRCEDMTYRAIVFEKPGDTVIGELVDIQETYFEKTKSTVNKYILHTDNGLESVIIGAIGDTQLAGRVEPGNVLRFEFREKKALTGGRTANIFDIKRLTREVSDGKEKDDPATLN